MIEAFRNLWFTVPVAAIVLIVDIIIAIIYTVFTLIQDYRGPRDEH